MDNPDPKIVWLCSEIEIQARAIITTLAFPGADHLAILGALTDIKTKTQEAIKLVLEQPPHKK